MKYKNQIQSFFYLETQFDNLGDAAINKEMIKLMALHSNVNLGISKLPLSFVNMIGTSFLESFENDKWSGREIFLLKIIYKRLLNNKCYLFLSPGGWIGELDGNLNLRSWFHAIMYFLMNMIGIKIIQLGVSYEDIGPRLLKLLKFRSKAYTHHYVRDQQSLDFLIKNKISSDGICPDLAFNKFKKVKSPSSSKSITFSFRSDQYQNQLNDIKKFIIFFLKNFDKYENLQFVAQVEKDINTNKQLSIWLKSSFDINSTFISATHSINFLEQTYSKTSIIVSNRLHALLIAGSVGNTMIAAPINNSNKKIQSLFEDVGLGCNVFSNDTILDKIQVDKAWNIVQKEFNSTELKLSIESCFNQLFTDESI